MEPCKVLQAMVEMGVLVPTGDMTAVRRTAQFFLNRYIIDTSNGLISDGIEHYRCEKPC